MTGFTNDDLTEFIEKNGGKVMNQISGKTTMLICKDTSLKSSKITKAQTMGIPIIQVNTFINKYKM